MAPATAAAPSWQRPWRGDPAEIVAAFDDDPVAVVRRLLRPPAWHAGAACVGADPELFFPSRGGSIAAAVAVCAGCAVVEPCLADALADPAHHDVGVRGGVSAAARRRMRVERSDPKATDDARTRRAGHG